MPVLRAMNASFEPCGYLDSSASVILERKLYEIGTIEIHIDRDATGANVLMPGTIVFLDSRRAAIIDSYDKDKNKGNSIMVAKGKQLKDICRYRITVPGLLEDTQFFGYDRYPELDAPDAPAESIFKHYADRHMVNPDDPNRVYPGLVIGEDRLRGPAMRWQSRFEALTAVYKAMGEQAGMGYDVYLDIENNQFIFDVVPGIDRTSSSDHPVIFSTEWSNVSSLKYSEDASKYMNTAYCGGAGENEGRLIQTVYEADVPRSGFGRREMWIDCGSTDSLDDLKYEGQYKLAENAYIKGLSGQIITAGPFKYLRDWDLGDIVTTQDEDDEQDARITGIKEVYERGKTLITPTLGKRNKNVLDEIRKKGAVR